MVPATGQTAARSCCRRARKGGLSLKYADRAAAFPFYFHSRCGYTYICGDEEDSRGLYARPIYMQMFSGYRASTGFAGLARVEGFFPPFFLLLKDGFSIPVVSEKLFFSLFFLNDKLIAVVFIMNFSDFFHLEST